ncbi:MAG TPA: hypothetical protein VMV45_18665, partial [Casimicrobiaceae bacterium]|nr:hypothetical protein [Casimicrobiaceae bacterium]
MTITLSKRSRAAALAVAIASMCGTRPAAADPQPLVDHEALQKRIEIVVERATESAQRALARAEEELAKHRYDYDLLAGIDMD